MVEAAQAHCIVGGGGARGLGVVSMGGILPSCMYTTVLIGCMEEIQGFWYDRVKNRITFLKVRNVFLKVTFSPWVHPVKIWLHTVSRYNNEENK